MTTRVSLASMGIPIACRLDGAAARSQLDEWRDLLSALVESAERIAPGELALRLGPDPARLAALIDLARREKACCPFFGFTFTVEADAVTLHVLVPDEAASVLEIPQGTVQWRVHEASRRLRALLADEKDEK